MKKSQICLLFFVFFTFFSCSKDDDSENTNIDELAYAELLESHPWKLDYQLLNAVEEDPYIIKFMNNGFIEVADFSEWSKNEEEWEIKDGKLIIDGMSLSIETLTSTNLVLSVTDDGTSYSYTFKEEGDADAFPQYIVGKIYRPVSVTETEGGVTEVFEIEDGHDFTEKIWFEENNTMTVTDTMLHYLSWSKISESFIFLEGQGGDLFEERENAGYEISLESTGDITLKTCYMYKESVKSSESSLIEATAVLRECNLWDYLNGPDWVLWEVDKNDEALTEFSDMPLGTIWFFNSYTNMIEERTSYSDADTEYLPWKFTEEPKEENIRVDITVEPEEVKTFKMMKGNIAELELSTEIDGDTYTFKFRVEDYVK